MEREGFLSLCEGQRHTQPSPLLFPPSASAIDRADTLVQHVRGFRLGNLEFPRSIVKQNTTKERLFYSNARKE